MTIIEPRMGPESYKTYSIVAPLATHFRPATCEEIGCEHYTKGWQVRVEGLSPQMLHAARTSGRKYAELTAAAGETWLVFEAGQPCFKRTEHRVPVGRPELFIVRDGDRRGNPRGTRARQHLRPELWQEDFAEHQQGLADAIERG